jgi:uncharacterized protein YggE
MRTRKLVVALAVLVAFAGCAAPIQSGASASSGSDAATTIDVSGTGQVSAEADLALVFASVTASAATADGARSAVATDAGRMRTALRDADVPDDAVTTTSFRISPRYDDENGESRVASYDAVHAFRIEVTPPRAGETIDVAVGNGAAQVNGVQFTLRDDTRAELHGRALERAVAAARADADTVASAADLTVTGVDHISTSATGVSPFDVRLSEAASGGGTVLEPGPVTVQADVSITYTAE